MTRAMIKSEQIAAYLRRIRVESAKVINLNDTSNTSEADKPTVPPISKAKLNEIAKSHKLKLSLYSKLTDVRAMQHNLQHHFGDDEIAKKAANVLEILHNKVSSGLKAEGNVSALRVEKMMSKRLTDISDAVVRTLNRRFETKATVALEDGVYNEATHPQHVKVVFIILKNVKSEDGSIEPQKVIALSEISNRVYINPALTKPAPVGRFSLGYMLTGKGTRTKDSAGKFQSGDFATVTKAMAKEAIVHVEEQFIADSHLAGILTKELPEGATSTDLSRFHEIKKINVGDKTLEITLTKMPQAKAQEVANDIYAWLYSGILAKTPNFRDRVIYKLIEKEGSYTLIFKFAHGQKSKGFTLHQSDIAHLRTHFSPEDVLTIMRALSNR